MPGQRSSIAGHQFVQPRPPVGAQWLVVADPLREQQALDAVDVPHPLHDQSPPLARDASPVLVLDARHRHHRTHPRLPALVGQQRADQRLAVELVRLGAPAAS